VTKASPRRSGVVQGMSWCTPAGSSSRTGVWRKRPTLHGALIADDLDAQVVAVAGGARHVKAAQAAPGETQDRHGIVHVAHGANRRVDQGAALGKGTDRLVVQEPRDRYRSWYMASRIRPPLTLGSAKLGGGGLTSPLMARNTRGRPMAPS
jgi:hypothetical protein